MDDPALAPLLSWDGLHVIINLMMVEERLRDAVRSVDVVHDVRLDGLGDVVRVWVALSYKGVVSRVCCELAEIRLRYRFLGFRIRRVRAIGRVRVPRAVIERLIARFAPAYVKVLRGHGIVVVDVRQWLPEELVLSILTVQATGRSLHIWFGAGELADLPADERPALQASVGSELEAGAGSQAPEEPALREPREAGPAGSR